MTFGYDANGNMTSRNGAPIQWTSYNLPSRIEHAGDAVEFQYGADRSRYVQIITEGASQKTRHYAGAEFEVLTWNSGSARADTHYIYANGEAIAQYITSNVDSDRLEYLHRDHHGSIVATSDTNGTLIDSIEYDAFGARDYGSQDLSTRGYTGHEQLDTVEMIHMNGRVQDPVLGRFISADPFVQAPYASQSLNRYSYAWNNPLSLVDPSGFQTSQPNCAGCDEFTVTGQISDQRDPAAAFLLWMLSQNGSGVASDLYNGPSAGSTGGAGSNGTQSNPIPVVTVRAKCPAGVGGKCSTGNSLRDDPLYWQCVMEEFAPCELEAGLREQVQNGTITQAEAYRQLAEYNRSLLEFAGATIAGEVLAEAAIYRGLKFFIGSLKAARGLANLPFRSGDVILRELQTSKGILDVAAEVQVVDRTLHLKDIAVFPRGADALSLGTREVMALGSQLAAEARALGFDQLRITGTRITGANPGKAVDVVIDLTQ
jgi:RHS repeat-associated protein